PASEPADGWTSWRVVRRDNSARIMMFFANTGEDTFWELGKRLFQDQHMSPHLLAAGFLQIGNPFFYKYDPVCFDTKSPRIEKRIVQLDHEAILQRGEMHIIKEIAPFFST